MIPKLVNLAKGQAFTLALALAVAAALAWPELGAPGGPLRPEILTKLFVALIFLIQGLTLPTRQLIRSAGKLRLHLFCQISNFVAAPLLMLGLLLVARSWIQPEIAAGFLFLAALPTTISSAVAMTASSEGDAAAALFSTALSNVLGIFATPLLCAQLIAATAGGALPPVLPLIATLAALALLPLAVGQALRPLARSRIDRSRPALKRIGNVAIVFIVYAAFCAAAQQRAWESLGGAAFFGMAAMALLYLVALSALVWVAAPLASRSSEERIAAFFCGSHKTIAAGIPMGALIFASANEATRGLVLLPILVFHPAQILLGGLLAPALARYASERPSVT